MDLAEKELQSGLSEFIDKADNGFFNKAMLDTSLLRKTKGVFACFYLENK